MSPIFLIARQHTVAFSPREPEEKRHPLTFPQSTIPHLFCFVLFFFSRGPSRTRSNLARTNSPASLRRNTGHLTLAEGRRFQLAEKAESDEEAVAERRIDPGRGERSEEEEEEDRGEKMSGIARGRLTEERKAWRKNHPHVRTLYSFLFFLRISILRFPSCLLCCFSFGDFGFRFAY